MSVTAVPVSERTDAAPPATTHVVEPLRAGRLAAISARTNRLVQVTGVVFAVTIVAHLVWVVTPSTRATR